MRQNQSEQTPLGRESDEQIDLLVKRNIERFRNIPLVQKAFELLDGLPEYLRYHTKAHTEDVFHEAVLFGTIDGLDDASLERLATAAAWHDVGFLVQQEKNEPEAVRLFEENSIDIDLPYSEDIKAMIMDTQLQITTDGPQIIMSNEKSAYLLDADVSNFGRTDFWEKRQLVAEELGIDIDDKDTYAKFLKFALALIKNHEWHTRAAQGLRQAQTMLNIEALEKEIGELE